MNTSTKRLIEGASLKLRKSFRHVTPHALAVFAVLLVTGMLGSYLLASSHAATPAASTEAESGTISSAASSVADSAASGSSAVKFGKGVVTNPNCTPVENIPASFPNNCNTGYTNAPDYAASKMHSCSGPVTSNTTYNFCIFGGLEIGVQNSSQPSQIQISNVTFHDCLFKANSVDGALVTIYGGDNITFDYSTFQPNGTFQPGVQIAHNTSYQYGINSGSSYFSYVKQLTVTNSDFWGFGNAIDTAYSTQAKPQVFRNNWIHDAANDGNGDYHTDGIGTESTSDGGSYVVIDHNTIESPGNTNAIAFQQGTYSHFTITNNYLSGFNYTVSLWQPATYTTFTGNVWGTNYQQYYGPLRPTGFWSSTGSVWKDNTVHFVPGTAIYQWYDTSNTPTTKHFLITAADDGHCWLPNDPSGNVSDISSAACNGTN